MRIFLEKYAVIFGKAMVYKKELYAYAPSRKNGHKVNTHAHFSNEPYEKKSMCPFSISKLGTCWQGGASQKNAHENAHAHE